jgi:hypothetical protein
MPSRPVSNYTVTSVSEFVSLLEGTFPDSEDLLFRGQGGDWPLLPKIARIRLRPGTDLLVTEQRLLNDFKLQAPSLVDLGPESDWEWLSLAQHYGMATRLLDWTSNPLAALWFSVEKPAETPCPPDLPKPPAVVWVFDSSKEDHVQESSKASPFSGERTRVFRPKHIARRIIAQAGWHTVHKYIHDRKGFVPLERQSRYRGDLTKIVVPAEHFCNIRFGLDQCGVNAASLLTDLSGLCRHIEWLHSLLEDEMLEDEMEDGMAKGKLRRPGRKARR